MWSYTRRNGHNTSYLWSPNACTYGQSGCQTTCTSISQTPKGTYLVKFDILPCLKFWVLNFLTWIFCFCFSIPFYHIKDVSDLSALPPLAFKRDRGHTISVMSPIRKPGSRDWDPRPRSPKPKETSQHRSGVNPSWVIRN